MPRADHQRTDASPVPKPHAAPSDRQRRDATARAVPGGGAQTRDAAGPHDAHARDVSTETDRTDSDRATQNAGVLSAGGTGGWNQFWFGGCTDSAHLSLFRVLMYGLFAVDSTYQLSRAARYASNGFNLSHADAFTPDALSGLLASTAAPFEPTPGVMFLCWFVQTVLALRVVLCGLSDESWWAVRRTTAERIALPALWGYTYFCSQLDNFQHHYLLFILLVLGATIDWEAIAVSGGAYVPSWQPRLILVQFSIVYVWTAIAKMDAVWMSGDMFPRMVSPIYVQTVHHLSSIVGFSLFRVLAVSTIGLELALAALIHAVPAHRHRARFAVFAFGTSFHLGLHFSGIRIGLFSFYCIGLLAFLCPLPRRIELWLSPAPISAPATTTTTAASSLSTLTRLALEVPFAAGAIGLVVFGLPLRDAFAELQLYAATNRHSAFAPDTAITIVAAVLFALWCGDQWMARRDGRSYRRTLCFVTVLCVLFGSGHPANPYRFGDEYRDLTLDIAQSQLALGRFREAVAAFERAIEIDPLRVTTYNDAGIVWMAVDPEKAFVVFQKVIKQFDADSVKANTGLCNYYTMKNDRVSACRIAERLRTRIVPAVRGRTCNGEACELEKHFCTYTDQIINNAMKQFNNCQ